MTDCKLGTLDAGDELEWSGPELRTSMDGVVCDVIHDDDTEIVVLISTPSGLALLTTHTTAQERHTLLSVTGEAVGSDGTRWVQRGAVTRLTVLDTHDDDRGPSGFIIASRIPEHEEIDP